MSFFITFSNTPQGSTSLWRDISRYSCFVHYARGSVPVDALKTSVTLMTLSIDGGHNAALKQMCSREVSKIHNKKCAFSSTSQQQLAQFFALNCLLSLTQQKKKSVVDYMPQLSKAVSNYKVVILTDWMLKCILPPSTLTA